ncbi:DUF6378 domain-containing protein [Rhodococcus antarcticus]|uniref:DUF6378 domain-containing protein n=1 Tax=Rhodococcus antarcticus TaxID=2987751 RepID=A0ABY6NWB9_9NOCA|nr:DUF6378 domain-containing protein [Rhodococcus antarcticus]UZJ23685.1 DUF6378 domain-containing protein [Rhodococcus antarcticus]
MADRDLSQITATMRLAALRLERRQLYGLAGELRSDANELERPAPEPAPVQPPQDGRSLLQRAEIVKVVAGHMRDVADHLDEHGLSAGHARALRVEALAVEREFEPSFVEREPELSLLQRAEATINGDREDEYGEASVSFERIAAYWSTYLKGEGVMLSDRHLAGLDIAAMMVLMKVSRLAGGYHEDTALDLAGYAGLMPQLRAGTL